MLHITCRFLQGPETDPATVRKIREAIDNETDVTVQLINYTKSGKLPYVVTPCNSHLKFSFEIFYFSHKIYCLFA